MTGSQAYTPSAWTFQGSNNDTDWTTLDTQSGISSGWTIGVPREFIGSNSTAYRYYRINFTAFNDGTYLIIGEVEFKNTPITNNMTVVTTAQTSDASVSTARALVEYNPVDSIALNTDLTVDLSCNGGTNWTAGTLSLVTAYSQTNRSVAETNTTSCTSGTSFQARVKSLNNKSVQVYGTTIQAFQ